MSIPGYTSSLSYFCSGKPTANAAVGGYVACLPSKLLSSGHRAVAGTTSAAGAVFTVKSNGSSVGTITFSAGQSAATISINETAFSAGQVLTITAPGTQDTSLADVSITLLMVGT